MEGPGDLRKKRKSVKKRVGGGEGEQEKKSEREKDEESVGLPKKKRKGGTRRSFTSEERRVYIYLAPGLELATQQQQEAVKRSVLRDGISRNIGLRLWESYYWRVLRKGAVSLCRVHSLLVGNKLRSAATSDKPVQSYWAPRRRRSTLSHPNRGVREDRQRSTTTTTLLF